MSTDDFDFDHSDPEVARAVKHVTIQSLLHISRVIKSGTPHRADAMAARWAAPVIREVMNPKHDEDEEKAETAELVKEFHDARREVIPVDTAEVDDDD